VLRVFLIVFLFLAECFKGEMLKNNLYSHDVAVVLMCAKFQ